MITQSDIKKIRKKEPCLGLNGITNDHWENWAYKDQNIQQGVKADREGLFKAEGLRQIEICLEWLSRCSVAKTINSDGISYSLKHDVSAWSDGEYVSNGAFIAAVILKGIPYRALSHDSINIQVALSKRSIKQLRKECADQGSWI